MIVGKGCKKMPLRKMSYLRTLQLRFGIFHLQNPLVSSAGRRDVKAGRFFRFGWSRNSVIVSPLFAVTTTGLQRNGPRSNLARESEIGNVEMRLCFQKMTMFFREFVNT